MVQSGRNAGVHSTKALVGLGENKCQWTDPVVEANGPECLMGDSIVQSNQQIRVENG